MKSVRWWIWGVFFAGITADASQETLPVSAAISLREVLEYTAPLFEKKHPSLKLSFNFASSGALRQQIEAGAPCDLFISADWNNVNQLAKAGLLIDSSTQVVAANSMVLVASRNSPTISHLNDLLSIQKIVIGNPKTVPAGKYAQQVLEHAGLWSELKPKLIYAEHVRQVLDYVARDEVDAGLVYLTDARTSPEVRVAMTCPEESHEPIEYPAVIPHNAAHPKISEDFIRYLLSDEGQEIFKKYGFQSMIQNGKTQP